MFRKTHLQGIVTSVLNRLRYLHYTFVRRACASTWLLMSLSHPPPAGRAPGRKPPRPRSTVATRTAWGDRLELALARRDLVTFNAVLVEFGRQATPVDARLGPDGRTALGYVLAHAKAVSEAEGAFVEFLQSLALRGANCNLRGARSSDDMLHQLSPLHYAASHGLAAMVEALLTAGVDVSLPDSSGASALVWTMVDRASPARTRILETLLAAGCDPLERADDGQTPLNEVFSHCLSGGNAAEDPARLQLCQELVGRFLGLGADLRAPGDGYGGTPLHCCVVYDRGPMTRWLLELGADARARCGGGRTPLHRAAHVGAARALVNAGADVNARDRWQCTPLYLAVSAAKPDLALVSYLLSVGADWSVVADGNPAHTARQVMEQGKNPELRLLAKTWAARLGAEASLRGALAAAQPIATAAPLAGEESPA